MIKSGLKLTYFCQKYKIFKRWWLGPPTSETALHCKFLATRLIRIAHWSNEQEAAKVEQSLLDRTWTSLVCCPTCHAWLCRSRKKNNKKMENSNATRNWELCYHTHENSSNLLWATKILNPLRTSCRILVTTNASNRSSLFAST